MPISKLKNNILDRGSNAFNEVLGGAMEKRKRVARGLGRILVATATLIDPSLEDRLKTGTHDSLTGLLNRHSFIDQLERDRTDGKQIALLFIDLNNFSKVNTSLSHSGGDELLRDFSGFITGQLRESDVVGYGSELTDEVSYKVGRFGGDEFWVSVDMTGRDGEVHREAPTQVKDRILSKLDTFIDQHPSSGLLREVGFGAAIGMAVPQEGEPIEDLITRVSSGMYEHKKQVKEQE